MNVYSCIDGIDALYKKRPSVVWLRGKEYGPLSIYTLRSRIAKQACMRVIYPEDTDLSAIQMQCASAFLGDTYYYYLGDISKQLKQKKSAWFAYVSSYTGPHTLIFWAETSLIDLPSSSWMIIDMPENINQKSAIGILETLYGDQKKSMVSLLNGLWSFVPSLSFEEFCRFGMYARVVGVQDHQFIKEYIPLLTHSDSSLFTLSQYLLSKKSDEFYRQWAVCSKKYPTIFWISFWSDQLWRATLFVRYMHANNRNEAYEIAKYRLPFSFTKTDWYHTSQDTLQDLYAYMCNVDFMVKNGGDDAWLELFFLKWFRS